MLIERNNSGTGYSAIFEDDGKVAYAYRLDNGKIVADVWLYNRAVAPEAPEWRDRSKAPFFEPSWLHFGRALPARSGRVRG